MNMGQPKKELLPKMQTISNKHFKPENMLKMATAVQNDGYKMLERDSKQRVQKNFLKR
jgi:hypothetical protein